MSQSAEKVDTTIGKAGRPIYGFAFGGGAFDTTMYLGVVHALLTSERRAPDIVLGVSAGSLAATALAEVLQAGSKLGPKEAEEARVARFREFLAAYRDAPRELRRAFVPDLFELTSRAPLKPMDSPLHCKAERDDRGEYVQSLSGLVNLMNDLLSLHVNIRYLAQAVYRWLNLAAVGNYSSPFRRWRFLATNGIKIIVPTFWNLWRLTPLARQYLAALMRVIRPRDGFKAQSAEQLIASWRTFWSRFFRMIELGVSGLLLYVCMIILTAGFIPFLIYKLVKSLWQELMFVVTKRLPIPSLGPSTGFMGGLRTAMKDIGHRLLRQYELHDELSHSYPLKQMLVRLFDPEHYYGKLKLSQVVEKAIQQADEVEEREKSNPPKTFSHYLTEHPHIYVAPVAAEVVAAETGKEITVLPQESRVVDGLMAANAIPIFFKPVTSGELVGNGSKGAVYTDAAPVTDAPISLLIDHLKGRTLPDVPGIHLYPVRAFSSQGEPVPLKRPLDSVLALAERALDLQRYQHIRLEYRLTKLYSALLPKAVQEIGDKYFISAHLHPIEASPSLNLNERIFQADTIAEQDRLLLEAVATGCRKTMEVILEREVAHHGKAGTCVPCTQVVHMLLKREDRQINAVPDPSIAPGPGLPEVCRVCRSAVGSQSLQVLGSQEASPLWPHRDMQEKPHFEPSRSTPVLSKEFQRRDADLKVPDEPWVTLVLSGGVFRGVFQIGVLSALRQASVQPKLFAGASVGSIMAAMAARLFTTSADGTLALQRLAATFIALDRLVVTDRLADFVRRFLIRANDVRISPKNLDHFLRRLDQSNAGAYSKNARTVLAGIERLFFISPFESLELIQAVHDEESSKSAQLLRDYSAYFFERYGVGMELLGAEPLRLLIMEHVLDGIDGPYKEKPWYTPFDYFRKHDKYLLATSTNATKGELHVFGWEAAEDDKPCTALLVEALLASSAFPAVFRPRRFAEVYPCDADRSVDEETKFIDGGLMDNLPLDHVVSFLHKRAQKGHLVRRPKEAPHLLLTASLEPEPESLKDSALTSEALREDWRLVQRRVKELHYNRKIRMFQEAQEDFRKIVAAQGSGRSAWPPLDMKVMAVVPKWLCGTFGFHGTLGFRQHKQAASIAHGCAMTFAALSKLQDEKYATHYGIREEFVKGAFKNGQVDTELLEEWNLSGHRVAPGTCWFRMGSRCPFSAEALADTHHRHRENGTQPLLAETARTLPMIYEYCRMPETHSRHD